MSKAANSQAQMRLLSALLEVLHEKYPEREYWWNQIGQAVTERRWDDAAILAEHVRDGVRV